MRRASSTTGVVAAAAILSIASIAQAAPEYTGGAGVIAFGVAPYGGAPNVGAPTYIYNNVTDEFDILASPGNGSLGGYLTANPVVANNTSEYIFNPPFVAWQSAGGNIHGPFGSAGASNFGTTMGYYVSDFNPGGGSASYVINSSVTTWEDVDGTDAGETFGAWVTMGGTVSTVGSADVVSMRVSLYSDTVGSPFEGGYALPEMVLAISRNLANNNAADYNVVTYAPGDDAAAALILDNAFTGTFRAAALSLLTLEDPIPAGDEITVLATLTAYADPASMEMFDLLDPSQSDLLGLLGDLPSTTFMGGNDTVPEPASLLSIGMGLLLLTRRSRKV